MMNRVTRISLSALALLAAFTLGMLFAQRVALTPARAAGDNPIVTVFPIETEQKSRGDGTTTIDTRVTKVMAIRADGTVSIKSSAYFGSQF